MMRQVQYAAAAAGTAVLAALMVAGPPLQAQRGGGSAEARLGAATAGRTAGAPVRCINRRLIRSTRRLSGGLILYQERGGRIYVNRPGGGCEGLRDSLTLINRSTSQTLCEGEIVEVVDPTINVSVGSCSLGAFVPYDRSR